ncbi:hypothetical protein IMZ11_25575, partial [Microtetraspora sp. AC03309]|uniref:hypothetical protein n=1 Tax=Microtetraspora sp. AC03309 TaxID=2779376 RepID=UPI001E40D6F8
MTQLAEEHDALVIPFRPTPVPAVPAVPRDRRRRIRRAVQALRQGRYASRTVKVVYATARTPLAGTGRMAGTAWRWIRADDYAAAEDLQFREKVRTRRRRTAWWVGGGYALSTAASTVLWSPSAPLLAAGAIIGLGTAVEAHKQLTGRTTPLKFPGLGKKTPGEDMVTRAAIAAKLGSADGMRLAAPVLTEQNGWSTILQLPAGQRARKALGKEADFASALGVGETQVVFELIGEHAGRLAVYVSKADPFLKVYPSPLLGRTEPLDFWQGVPAGVNGRGRPEVLRLVDASLLVAGEPRAGKSAAVNGIIGAAALAVTPKIHLWDGKGAGDHRAWRRIAETAEKRNAAGLLDHLRSMQDR